MKKNTTEQAVVAFRMLSNAKITKMEDKEKFLIIRAMKALKPISTSYDDFIKDAAAKLRPEGYDAVEAKQGVGLTKEEQKMIEKYNSDVTECVKSELSKEIEFDFEPLGEEAFGRFISSNDYSVAEIMALEEVIA